MRLLLPIALLGLSLSAASAPAAAPTQGAAASGMYRNLFREYLGKSDAEIEAKVNAAFQQIFFGDENSQRLLYPVPGDMAYVPDINSNDVRSEGLSYGMMIAVQMDHQKEFNQIWKFAKHYMWHDAGPLAGYFTWHVAFNGRQLRDTGPAPDGEEWFVMALFFASHRWGDGEGIFNYGAEAQSLLHTMLHKDEDPNRGSMTSMFDRAAKQVVFTPHLPGSKFTDPSYHLPAYYELWSRWAASTEDRAFLAEVTKTSRELFKKAAHPVTGLMPDYSNFDGTPYKARWGNHENFLFDAWRTLSNPALDYSWWAADAWQVEQSNRVLKFLASRGPDIPVQFTLEGKALSSGANAEGLLAMAATAALAADREIGQPFVQRLWDLKMPEGRLRYYNGLLTMIGLLEVSGNFRIYGPPAAK